jgi:hypothetical protein
MADSGPRRKLAAILSADVAGYGRLMQDDEALALKPDYTLEWHFATHNMHESYHEGYIEGARKAGLPLGDLEALAPTAR